MPRHPTLIILRGNSASGKSTVARRVQRSFDRGEVAMIGQDHLRRELLWVQEGTDNHVAGLLDVMVRHCLEAGQHVIVEGIFGREWYGEAFAAMVRAHAGPSLVYYLDVSLPETLRRHRTKTDSAGEVPEADVASWYREKDALGLPGEAILGEELGQDELVRRVLEDLSTVGKPTPGGSVHGPRDSTHE